MDRQTIVVFDTDPVRRGAVYREMAKIAQAITIASLDDLETSWPDNAWFFVYDNQRALDSLHTEMARSHKFNPIVVFSENPMPSRAVAALHGGAMNYVGWPSTSAELAAAMKGVWELALVRCRRSAARVQAQAKVTRLSGRERQVLDAIRHGLSSKEIGRHLGISNRTVDIHRANALAKLGVRNAVAGVGLLIEAEHHRDYALAA